MSGSRARPLNFTVTARLVLAVLQSIALRAAAAERASAGQPGGTAGLSPSGEARQRTAGSADPRERARLPRTAALVTSRGTSPAAGASAAATLVVLARITRFGGAWRQGFEGEGGEVRV
jgi:hypothetical protein